MSFFYNAFVKQNGINQSPIEPQPDINSAGTDSKTAPSLRCLFIVGSFTVVGGFCFILLLSFWIPNRSERFFLVLPFAYLVYRQLTGRPLYKDIAVLGVIVAACLLFMFFPFPFPIGWKDMTFRFVSIPVMLWGVHGVFLIFIGVRWTINELVRFSFRRPAAKAASRKEIITRISASTLVFVVFFLPVFMYMAHFHRAKFRSRVTPLSECGAEFENIVLKTRDNISLSAWYVPAAGKIETTVIITHGIGANKGNALGWVGTAWAAGANVLVYDSRGHGDSGGWSVSLGYREIEDVRAAVRYLKEKKPESAKHIICWSFSAGTAAVVRAAAQMPEIDIVIIDSPITSFADMVRDYAKNTPGFVKWYVVSFARILACLDFGIDIEHDSPLENIAKISPHPVIIVHGTSDRLVPVECGKRLYMAAKKPKYLLLVEGAGHVGSNDVSEKYDSLLRDAIRGNDSLSEIHGISTEKRK
jgi:pimeloyl-ACP methyl ester carboxylesterase